MHYLKDRIKTVPNFPKPGIIYRDITPILENFNFFQDAVVEITHMAHKANVNQPTQVEKVIGIESRGFIFGSAVALGIMAGFVPVRKSVGTEPKLPRPVFSASYDLEYGSAILDIHKDSILPGERVIIVDDVLATGGTAEATAMLVNLCGGIVAKMIFLVELKDLGGRERLKGHDVESLIQF